MMATQIQTTKQHQQQPQLLQITKTKPTNTAIYCDGISMATNSLNPIPLTHQPLFAPNQQQPLDFRITNCKQILSPMTTESKPKPTNNNNTANENKRNKILLVKLNSTTNIIIIIESTDDKTINQNINLSQMERKIKSLINPETITLKTTKTSMNSTTPDSKHSFPTEQQSNEPTNTFAASIKSIFNNLIMNNNNNDNDNEQTKQYKQQQHFENQQLKLAPNILNYQNNSPVQQKSISPTSRNQTSEQNNNYGFDWPDSFIQLLNSLSLKQQQQQQRSESNNNLISSSQSATNSKPTSTSSTSTSSSSTSPSFYSSSSSKSTSPTSTSNCAQIRNQSSPTFSSLAFDDRDFDLMALQLNSDHATLNADSNDVADTHSIWLMNFNSNSTTNTCLSPIPIPTKSDSKFPIALQCSKPFVATQIEPSILSLPSLNVDTNNLKSFDRNNNDNDGYNNNTNENNCIQTNTDDSKQPANCDSPNEINLINLLKLLRNKSASTPNIKHTLNERKLQSLSNLNHSFERHKSFPSLRFDQITVIEFPAKSELYNLSQKPLESMLLVQDFDEDDEESRNGADSTPVVPAAISTELTSESPTNQVQQQQQQSLVSQASVESSSSKKQSSIEFQQQQQQDEKALNATDSGKAEADGKYSLLQFALYNFREAIDKYSLESRASKVRVPGDTSTLRGSLKLIETLRNSKSAGSGSSNLFPTSSGGGSSNSSTNGKESRKSSKLLPALNTSTTSNHNNNNNDNNNDWTWRELAEMVKYTKAPIKQSLLKLQSDDLNKRAVDCFLAIMQYMGDLPITGNHHHQGKHHHSQSSSQDEVECVYLILMNCHNFPILRDEIYCQLMKQTTNNKSTNPDSCLMGWRLFSIIAAYFDCSETFKPYLLKYLETAAYDKRRAYCSVASLCLQNLRKTFKYNGRKNVPSIEEIAATSAGRNSKRQIYRLPGGTERVINTKSTTVVEDIIHEICSNMLNVTDLDEMLEFSLYCIADGDLYTMPLNRDEYILDITTELIKNHQQYFLIFCRSIWHYPLRLDSKLYIEVIFNQIAPDYLEGLLLVLPNLKLGSNKTQQHYDHILPITNKKQFRLKNKLVKEIARIAALLHRASGTDYMPHKDEIKYLLPKPIITVIKQYQRSLNNNNQSLAKQVADQSSSSASGSCLDRNMNSLERSSSTTTTTTTMDKRQDLMVNNDDNNETVITTPQKWIELVQANWREMSAFDTLDAKAQFLDIVRHWPLFGSSFFAIKYIQRDLIQPLDFILALNKLGIQMLDRTTHETIHKYPFNEVISTRKVRSEDGALFLDLKCGNLMKRTIIRIQTDQAHEISRLIRQYIDIELLQQKQHNKPTTIINSTD